MNQKDPILSFIKYLKSIFIVCSSALLFSCSSDIAMDNINTESAIFGTWISDTISLQPYGKMVYRLEFNKNGSFVHNTLMYNVYNEKEILKLSSYTEYIGNYVLSSRQIYFVSKQQTSMDSFVKNEGETLVKDEIIFENCSYKISKDTLNLTYTTYPADSPVNTKRTYYKFQ